MNEAERLFTEAAKQGLPDAQFNLGNMYENGQGVKQDYSKAREWYEKAAKQGHARAQNNLGFMYYHGQSVKQDYTKAKEWYEKAVKQETELSAEELLVATVGKVDAKKRMDDNVLDLMSTNLVQLLGTMLDTVVF